MDPITLGFGGLYVVVSLIALVRSARTIRRLRYERDLLKSRSHEDFDEVTRLRSLVQHAEKSRESFVAGAKEQAYAREKRRLTMVRRDLLALIANTADLERAMMMALGTLRDNVKAAFKTVESFLPPDEKSDKS